MKRTCSAFSNLVVVAALVGCGDKATQAPPTENHDGAGAQAADEHDHHGAGPHGGTILEWGGGAFHVEFTVDHVAKSSAVYLLGGDAKTPAPIKADKLTLTINEPAFQVELAAQPLDGEAGGMASRFVGTHENLGIVREFAGTISGEVEGTPYAGDFTEEAGEHGHDH